MKPGWILAMLSMCSFTAALNQQIISPLVVDISQEFSVSVSVVGLLVTVNALTCAVMAFLSGPFMDRLSRKTVMVAGTGGLALAALGCGIAWSFSSMIAFRILAGVGVALLQPAIYAAVGDLFDYRDRGKAISWVISTNTVAPIVGIPIGALLAQQFSWRWTWVFLAVLMGAITVVNLFSFPTLRRPPAPARDRQNVLRPYVQILSNRNARSALLAILLAGACWFGWTTFLGAFYMQSFALQTGHLAPIMAINGVALMIGSSVGGRLGDRFGKRRLIVMAAPVMALSLAFETNVIVSVWIAAAANILVVTFNGARFTSMTALITEVVPGARGAMMSLNSVAISLGSTLGTALGGLVVTLSGYGGLGLALSIVGLLGAAFVAFGVRETAVAAETA